MTSQLREMMFKVCKDLKKTSPSLCSAFLDTLPAILMLSLLNEVSPSDFCQAFGRGFIEVADFIKIETKREEGDMECSPPKQ